MEQQIRFFLSAAKLADVVGNGEIDGVFLDLGFEKDTKIVIRVSAMVRNGDDVQSAGGPPGTAIPTPPGGTQLQFLNENIPEGSPTFDDVYSME